MKCCFVLFLHFFISAKYDFQCVIEHYLSVTNVHSKYIWPIQIPETTIYQEDKQDNLATEPFRNTDFEAIQQYIFRQQRLFEINRPFSSVSRDISRSVQLLSFFGI